MDIKTKVIAIDFDGTLCEDRYPDIGRPIVEVIEVAKKKQAEGYKLILWTCRTDNLLKQAVAWCFKYGLIFDAVNQNLDEVIEEFGGNPRKISATEYWDDRTINPILCKRCSDKRLDGFKDMFSKNEESIYFFVELKNGDILYLDKKCNHINHEHEKLCRFIKDVDGKQKTLALIPYDNILCIHRSDIKMV